MTFYYMIHTFHISRASLLPIIQENQAFFYESIITLQRNVCKTTQQVIILIPNYALQYYFAHNRNHVTALQRCDGLS